VTFSVEPAPGASGYRIQIARDADLLDLIRDARMQAPSATFSDLADGTYFVRVSVIDANGLEGIPRVYAFERRANELSATAAPHAGSHAYRFVWRASRADPGTRFRLVLSRHEDLREPVVDAVDLAETSLVVSDLPAGDYFWRVVSEQYDHGRFYETIGAVRTFTLAK
jgi:predicted phage tail protein